MKLLQTGLKLSLFKIFFSLNVIEGPEGRLNDLLLLFVCIKSNGKVLEETLAGINSDDVKTTLKRLCRFKMVLPLLQVLQQISPHSFVTLLHKIDSITNGSEG